MSMSAIATRKIHARRKLLPCLILVFMLICAALPVFAEPLTVSAPGTRDGGLPSVHIRWEKSNCFYILIAAWNEGSDSWEACLSGLPEKLTADQISLFLRACRQGKTATVTGAGLIDAEKWTNKLPLSYGEYAFRDPPENEGDSSLCWAASVSDMLCRTGWIKKASDPVTGRCFSDEDDLFGYFSGAFRNKGAYHGAALQWVFTGEVTEDLATPLDDTVGPLVSGHAGEGLYTDLRQDTSDTPASFLSAVRDTLRTLKTGSAVGASLFLNSTRYPLRSNPEIRVTYESDQEAFTVYDVIHTSFDRVREHMFVPGGHRGEPVFVDYDPAAGRYFEIESGATVEKDEILIGEFVHDEETGRWYNVEYDWDSEGNDRPYYIRISRYGADDIDLEHPETCRLAAGGDHAVTVMGYVMNLSEPDPARQITTLVLADSDNSAAIFRPDKNTPPREKRPNIYTAYPTSVISTAEGNTLAFTEYLPWARTQLFSVTSLKAAPENRPDPPPTGDGSRPELWLALLILAVFGVVKGTGSLTTFRSGLRRFPATPPRLPDPCRTKS